MKTCDQMWNLINEEANVRWISHLSERWLDEGKYEDIEDYRKALMQKIPFVMNMTKRPFGFSVACSDGTLRVWVKITGADTFTLEGEAKKNKR